MWMIIVAVVLLPAGTTTVHISPTRFPDLRTCIQVAADDVLALHGKISKEFKPHEYIVAGKCALAPDKPA